MHRKGACSARVGQCHPVYSWANSLHPVLPFCHPDTKAAKWTGVLLLAGSQTCCKCYASVYSVYLAALACTDLN